MLWLSICSQAAPFVLLLGNKGQFLFQLTTAQWLVWVRAARVFGTCKRDVEKCCITSECCAKCARDEVRLGWSQSVLAVFRLQIATPQILQRFRCRSSQGRRRRAEAQQMIGRASSGSFACWILVRCVAVAAVPNLVGVVWWG